MKKNEKPKPTKAGNGVVACLRRKNIAKNGHFKAVVCIIRGVVMFFVDFGILVTFVSIVIIIEYNVLKNSTFSLVTKQKNQVNLLQSVTISYKLLQGFVTLPIYYKTLSLLTTYISKKGTVIFVTRVQLANRKWRYGV